MGRSPFPCGWVAAVEGSLRLPAAGHSVSRALSGFWAACGPGRILSSGAREEMFGFSGVRVKWNGSPPVCQAHGC